MTDGMPETVREGGYLLVLPGQDIEAVWFNELDEATRAVVSKLTTKNVITQVVPDGDSIGRRKMYNIATDRLDEPKGGVKIYTNPSDSDFRMRYCGYSPDCSHSSYEVDHEAWSSEKVGYLAKHELLAHRVFTNWDGDTGSTVTW